VIESGAARLDGGVVLSGGGPRCGPQEDPDVVQLKGLVPGAVKSVFNFVEKMGICMFCL
jgi:hypothetical protein